MCTGYMALRLVVSSVACSNVFSVPCMCVCVCVHGLSVCVYSLGVSFIRCLNTVLRTNCGSVGAG